MTLLRRPGAVSPPILCLTWKRQAINTSEPRSWRTRAIAFTIVNILPVTVTYTLRDSSGSWSNGVWDGFAGSPCRYGDGETRLCRELLQQGGPPRRGGGNRRDNSLRHVFSVHGNRFGNGRWREFRGGSSQCERRRRRSRDRRIASLL